MGTDSFDYRLSPRRLLDKNSRELIRHENNRRNSKYPKHQAWIERALEALEKDDYSRMAFGAYLHIDDYRSLLCCSVIVTVSAFAPHLELKNLTVFKNDIPEELTNDVNFNLACLRTVIRQVQLFASDRGYRKLITELFRDDDQDRLIAQCFLERGFSVVGNQAARYSFTGDVVYLAWDVIAAYGYDPFDYEAASRWLIEAHIADAHPSGTVTLRLEANQQSKIIRKDVQIFKTGRADSKIAEKLSDEVAVIFIEDYFGENNRIESLDKVEFESSFNGRILIFDFMYDEVEWIKSLCETFASRGTRIKRLIRSELMQLLYGALPDNKAMRRLKSLPKYSEVGGLITLSDPDRFSVDRVKTIFRLKMEAIYIKLGPKGKFLLPCQYLVLCYYSTSSGKPEIWGYGEISEVRPIKLSVFDHPDLTTPAPDAAWREISDFDDLDMTSEPIWDKETFEKHNRYNASNEVVCIYLTSFVDIRTRRISLEKVAPDAYRHEFLAREYDAYLTNDEVATVQSQTENQGDWNAYGSCERTQSEGTGIPSSCPLGFGGTIKTVCIHAYSNEDTRLDPDPQRIINQLRARERFAEPKVENYATPYSVTHILEQENPHILHIAAHCSNSEITLRDKDGRPVSFGITRWSKLIGLYGTHIQIILLSCCDARELGRVVSEGGKVSVFFDVDVEDSIFPDFNEFFYNQLIQNSDHSSVITLVRKIIADWISFHGNGIRPLIAVDGIIDP